MERLDSATNFHQNRRHHLQDTTYEKKNENLFVFLFYGRKIARIAPILTIFGPKSSQRHDLFFEKIANERKNEQTNEKTKQMNENHIVQVVVIVVVSPVFVKTWIRNSFLVRWGEVPPGNKDDDSDSDAEKTKRTKHDFEKNARSKKQIPCLKYAL